MKQTEKKWYQKKRYILTLIILGFIVLSSSGNSKNTSVNSVKNSSYVSQPSYQSPTPIETNTRSYTETNTLSNDNYYTNTHGNQVHSPAYSNSVPVGASARCGDGTYSFSQSRRGTCSHHGGVANWL